MANGREYTNMATPVHNEASNRVDCPQPPPAHMLPDAQTGTMSGPPLDAIRLAMPDGHSWRVVRRHEMARIRTRRDSTDRRLFLFFFADSGAVRRTEVPPDFPDPATVSAREIVDLWHSSEHLS
jgi:hypothetical protein